MAIFWATSELEYNALRPNQELVVRHLLRGSDVFVSLPTGSGKNSVHVARCYVLPDVSSAALANATFLQGLFAFLLSPQAVYGMDDITSNRGETHPATCPLYLKTSTTTCFISGKTNSLKELKTLLRSVGRRKTSQREQLNTLLAVAIMLLSLLSHQVKAIIL